MRRAYATTSAVLLALFALSACGQQPVNEVASTADEGRPAALTFKRNVTASVGVLTRHIRRLRVLVDVEITGELAAGQSASAAGRQIELIVAEAIRLAGRAVHPAELALRQDADLEVRVRFEARLRARLKSLFDGLPAVAVRRFDVARSSALKEAVRRASSACPDGPTRLPVGAGVPKVKEAANDALPDLNLPDVRRFELREAITAERRPIDVVVGVRSQNVRQADLEATVLMEMTRAIHERRAAELITDDAWLAGVLEATRKRLGEFGGARIGGMVLSRLDGAQAIREDLERALVSDLHAWQQSCQR